MFFWYVKVIEFCPFLVVYRFSGPVLCQKNIQGCAIRYCHGNTWRWGACSTSVDNEKLMPGPQRFLLSMSRIIKRRPARLTFRHIRSSLPPLAHAESLGSTHRDYKHRANSPERMTCRHVEYARHADASCLFSQQDQNPCLNQAECKEGAERGLRGLGKHEESVDATRSSWVDESLARPPFD